MSEDLTFATAGSHGVHYARCWACITGSHYPIPTMHPWAGADDREHAAKTGQPEPTGRCGCPCVDDAAFCAEHLHPAPSEIELVSLGEMPCPVCGKQGACGYDAEGRPLIHSANDEDL